MQATEKQFHIQCVQGDVGRYCILPGDPGRCEAIAAYFDEPVHIGMNREFNIYTGKLLGEKVTVCSTGVGVGEPAVIGGKNFPAAADHNLIGAALKMSLRSGYVHDLDLLHDRLNVNSRFNGDPFVDMGWSRGRSRGRNFIVRFRLAAVRQSFSGRLFHFRRCRSFKCCRGFRRREWRRRCELRGRQNRLCC